MYLSSNSPAALVNCSYCAGTGGTFEEAELPVAVEAKSEENLND